MIKLFWYISSLVTILLILISSPNNSNLSNFITQTKIVNFSSSQLMMQKLIIFNALMFFVLTIVRIVY